MNPLMAKTAAAGMLGQLNHPAASSGELNPDRGLKVKKFLNP